MLTRFWLTMISSFNLFFYFCRFSSFAVLFFSNWILSMFTVKCCVQLRLCANRILTNQNNLSTAVSIVCRRRRRMSIMRSFEIQKKKTANRKFKHLRLRIVFIAFDVFILLFLLQFFFRSSSFCFVISFIAIVTAVEFMCFACVKWRFDVNVTHHQPINERSSRIKFSRESTEKRKHKIPTKMICACHSLEMRTENNWSSSCKFNVFF